MNLESNLYRSFKRFVFRGPGDARHERTAKALLEIFSSFIISDGQIIPRELEVAFDFVRNVFPDVDHGFIGRHLESVLTSSSEVSTSIDHLKGTLSSEQKIALSLQLYSIVSNGRNSREDQCRFLSLMTTLDEEGLGEAAIQELTSPPSETEINQRFLRIDFSSNNEGDIHLPPQGDDYWFRCYGIGGFILIRNLSDQPLRLRGHSLNANQLLQIRPDDELFINQWRLTYSDLFYFLQLKETGPNPDLYLVREDGKVTLNRHFTSSALAKLNFGHRVTLTPLQSELIFDSGSQALVKDVPSLFDYHQSVSIGQHEAVSFEPLRRLSMQTGQKFILPEGRRKVTVTNDPNRLKDDGLLLTPGLSEPFVLEIEFDPTTGLGTVHVSDSLQTIFANGLPIQDGPLVDGSLIRLSRHQSLRCRFSESLLDEERNLVQHLEIEGLNHSFRRGNKAIDNLSFRVLRGEMLCIIGPSGSGKSTLLEILASQRNPDSGKVLLNGLSLYERKGSQLASLISFMPQEEALTAHLTTREHLHHACAIRRPHFSTDAIQKRVNYLLGELGLERIGERQVGSPESKSLSGGERSRLNAGLDLIGGGEVFLFDEPISGLSSKDAEHVVQSLRELAHDKIVIASLHRPSEKILESFDQVLLLDRGGKLAFFGPSSDIVPYFESAAHDLEVLSEGHESHRGADFVFDVLEAPLIQGSHTSTRLERRFPPDFWQERFENHRVFTHITRPSQSESDQSNSLAENPVVDGQETAQLPSHGRRQKWRIFKTHLARSLKSKFRYQGTFYSILLEAPLLALLIGQTLRASAEGSYQFHSSLHLPSYLFLAVTVAMFFGLTNSATEVLRDRAVLRRERNCRPTPLLYLTSKFLVLSLLVLLQSAIFIACGHWLLDLHEMFLTHLFWMVATGCCGTSIALLVSVIVRSERTAISSIPLILVPQILLAGALIPFAEMNRGLFRGGAEGRASGAEPVPSVIMPLRYAFEGAIVSQATGNYFETQRRPLQKLIDYYKEKDSLSQAEEEALRDARESLSLLYVSSAPNAREAKTILSAPLIEAKRILQTSQEQQEARPVADYYVNQRTEALVDLAEASRLDSRHTSEPHVFLAEKKQFFGESVTTTLYCTMFLVGITTLSLLGAVFALRLSFLKT